MEFKTPDGREVQLDDMIGKVGQMVYSSPSVFSFFLPEYRPDGRLAEMDLAAPEAQLLTMPLLTRFLNGMTSLIDNGLSSCNSGFGTSRVSRSCGSIDAKRKTSDGVLGWKPMSTDGAQVAKELNLLLAAGRLNAHTTKVIAQEYDSMNSPENYRPVGRVGGERRSVCGCSNRADPAPPKPCAGQKKTECQLS